MNATEINKAIASITTSGAKFDNLVQSTAVAVAVHFAEHQDVAMVNRLFRAMPKGSRSTALASWLVKFLAINVNMGDTKKENTFIFAKAKVTDAVGAANEMWYNHKPEKSITEVFDLQQAIRSLLQKAGAATTLKNGDRSTLLALAELGRIPESDVTSKHFTPTVVLSADEATM